ncbi:MAG: phosphoethanolamine transferase [Deltaproteobacteria bacterium]|nr:phosphoethanolamine transferase [Deltaproteobacteria bacterium]
MSELLRAAWRRRWLLVANLYLVSPVLLYELHLGEGGPDRSLLFVLPASVLTLLTAQLVLRDLRLTHVLLLPLYVTVMADLFVIVNHHTRLSSGMLLVLVENQGDAGDYLGARSGQLALALALLVLVVALVWRGLRGQEQRTPRAALVVALLATVTFYAAVRSHVGQIEHVLSHDRSSPFGVVSQAITARSVYRSQELAALSSRDFRFGAKRTRAVTEPETYVLVLGESARPDRWQLFGAPVQTTPKLARLPGVHLFHDVVSQASLTKLAVPLLLTRGTIEDPRQAAGERSIVSALREAGFETIWLSTQQCDPFTGAINRYSGEAGTVRFFERRHDDVLVSETADALAQAKSDKVFVVVHTMGSHYEYDSRLPAGFDPFDARGAPDKHERLVRFYDDTVRLSDEVLTGLVEVVSRRPGRKALWFVSDHGENVEDDARALFGHNFDNEYDLPVPMFFWASPEYAAANADKLAQADAHARARLSTRSVFHSLLDLADVTVGDEATASRSVFSPRLAETPRMVKHDPVAVDFDRFVARTRGNAAGEEGHAAR